MPNNFYKTIESYMLEQMKDSAHDKYHIYRVLDTAMKIAAHEPNADITVLTAACFLHDIGRDAQAQNPNLCHAQVGAEMAYNFLEMQGYKHATHVRDCISTHRYRGDNLPQTIEAKILFDADKLEASGVIGIARTLIYAGQHSCPLYELDDNGKIIIDSGDTFVTEYNYKLKNISDCLYTAHAKVIAQKREKAARDFYNALVKEIDGI